MATVTTTITPEQKLIPFSGLADIDRDSENAARAEVVLSADSVVIAASGVGDNQLVLVRTDLPRNFSYVLLDLFINLSVSVGYTNNFDPNANVFLQDATSSQQRTFVLPFPLHADGVVPKGSTPLASLDYFMRDTPGAVVSPISGSAVRMDTRIFNQTSGDGEYNLTLYARFLQYNIEQAINYKVHNAVPVRG